MRGGSRTGANEAANSDVEPHAPAEAGQVIEPAGVPAVHAACVVAAKWAGRRGSGDRQVDGEVLDIKTGTDEAAPFGTRPATRAEATPRLRGFGSRWVQVANADTPSYDRDHRECWRTHISGKLTQGKLRFRWYLCMQQVT